MKQFILDAFTNQLFKGNQAAVCVMEQWPSEDLMKNITKENKFSETAFTVKNHDHYDLRWFTPAGEISLCGHATLATAWVLFHFYEKNADQIVFKTMSGNLYITRKEDYIVMDFPAYHCNEIHVTDEMEEVFDSRPSQAFVDRDLLLVFDKEETIRNMKPDFHKMLSLPGEGVGVTAAGKEYDCVSRFFDPKLKVNEDPVTGSIHCMIAPYWSQVLNKQSIHAWQASKRGGEMLCTMKGDRVKIAGKAVLYSTGEPHL